MTLVAVRPLSPSISHVQLAHALLSLPSLHIPTRNPITYSTYPHRATNAYPVHLRRLLSDSLRDLDHRTNGFLETMPRGAGSARDDADETQDAASPKEYP